MTCSPAQLEANRKNAAKSCGPKTAEGKEKSRANALKHGMTGAGIVLLPEDQGEVAVLAGQLVAEMKPSGAMGKIPLKRVAVLAVRLDRCVFYDEMMTAKRVRDAGQALELARHAEVEALGERLIIDPVAAVRGLRETAEGIAWLIRAWLSLKGDLIRPKQVDWGYAHLARIEGLLGLDASSYPPCPFEAPCRAIWGDFSRLDGEWSELTPRERKARAREQVGAMIDAEVAALRLLSPTRDSEEEARDRAEAPGRALFDPSREGDLARRYEAATERGMFRALREFRQVEEMAQAVVEAEPPASPPEPPPVPKTKPIPGPRLAVTTPDDGGTKPIEEECPPVVLTRHEELPFASTAAAPISATLIQGENH